MEFIPINQCRDRHLYRIQSRNLIYGVYNVKTNGFIGLREKFGDTYLFEEYHWDIGSPFGTVQPIKELGPLPDDIVLAEILGTIDQLTGKAVAFDKPVADGGKGWFFLESGEASKDIKPLSQSNKALFEFLENVEKGC